MGAGITGTDEVFSVRQQMWHGLGTVLPEYPTREEAQALVLPWEPIEEKTYRRVPFVTPTGEMGHTFEEIPGQSLRVRSDNSAVLGTVNDTLGLVTNGELFDIAEAVEGLAKGEVRFETGGSLYGGSKVWLLLALVDPIVVPGDPNGTTIQYYGLQNDHSGGGSLRGQATSVRIVCANTSQMADLDAAARGTEFTFRHTLNVKDRIEDAKVALAGWRESVRAFRLYSEHMMSVPVTRAQRELFVTEFVPMPPPHAVSDRVVGNVEAARDAIRDILAGPTCEGINDTAYGLVQAAVEYRNHVQKARSTETRFKRTYLDRDQITSDAVALARQVALV